MVKILFLAHRVPFPPDKGDKIRAFNILTHLAARHDVWLGAGADDIADLRHFGAAKALCRDVCFAPLGGVRRAGNMLLGALAGAPISVARFRHPVLGRWIGKILHEERPDIVFVYSSAMAQYVVGRMPPQSRLIVDFVDADAEKWRAYAEGAAPPMRWVFQAEYRRLVRFERAALDASVAGILISKAERRLFARLLPEGADKLRVMANGVDTDYFQPAAQQPNGSAIVLCGRMDYLPNVDAAVWFAREILPLVQRRCPQAVFRIVGAAPTSAVLALRRLPGVEVTGAVPDVRPYLAEAAVTIAPLRIARGIQNKVLEGMAAGVPVVATPQALEGIDAVVGRQVLTGADVDGFAEAVLQVLRGEAPADLGACGRSFVLRRHQWSAQLAVLDRLIEEAVHEGSGQASA